MPLFLEALRKQAFFRSLSIEVGCGSDTFEVSQDKVEEFSRPYLVVFKVNF